MNNFTRWACFVSLLGSLYAATLFQSAIFAIGWFLLVLPLALNVIASDSRLLLITKVLCAWAPLLLLSQLNVWVSHQIGAGGNISDFGLCLYLVWVFSYLLAMPVLVWSDHTKHVAQPN